MASKEQAAKPALVLAVVNQKGGVGKSTTAVNLAAALGELKKKVLLIDLDPQGNATSGYGLSKNHRESCVYNALLGETTLEEIAEKTNSPSVTVVPATIQLAGAEVELVSAISRETRLKKLIDAEKDAYDFVLIDCAPSLGLLTINALTAADGLIIPIQTEFYALEGLSKLLDSVRLVNTHLNAHLSVFGVVMTMYNSRTNLSKQVVEEVQNYFGDVVFKTLVPRTVRLSEAPSYGIPITEYDSSGKGAIAYRDLAKEVISRASK